jgi:chromosome segregation ATPase
MLTNLDQTYE